MTRYTVRDARAWTFIALMIMFTARASTAGNVTATAVCASIATALLLLWARRRQLEEVRS